MSRKIYILSKVRPFLTREMALLIFKICVLPYADIGDIFFYSRYKYMLNKLQIAQNYSLKIVYGRNSNLDLDQVHTQAKLLKLEDRRRFNQLEPAYKMNKLGYVALVEVRLYPILLIITMYIWYLIMM